MTRQSQRGIGCHNANHGRANAAVRHCPTCGGVVNEQVRAQECTEPQHAASRMRRLVFCVDCGTRLIPPR